MTLYLRLYGSFLVVLSKTMFGFFCHMTSYVYNYYDTYWYTFWPTSLQIFAAASFLLSVDYTTDEVENDDCEAQLSVEETAMFLKVLHSC